MQVRLDYGEAGLPFATPEEAAEVEIVRPRFPPPVSSVEETLREALDRPSAGPPLAARIPRGASVAVAICDGTRPQPREAMLRALLETLPAPPANVTVLVATGTHRNPPPPEREALVGSEIFAACEVLGHDCRDDASLARAPGGGTDIPVTLNRRLLEADIRITTGFVEPHFFAGFSGGPKMVAPGLAGLETILHLHDDARIGHPDATFGITEGNPVHDAVRALSAANRVDFALDVLLDGAKRITGAFAGDLAEEHRAACLRSRAEAMYPLREPFDVVVTTNSGYPLDQNLYQAIKGMAAAALIVKPGGVILCAAECRAGLPDGSAWARALKAGASIREVREALRKAPTRRPDDWQVQVLCRIRKKARVGLFSSLPPETVRSAHLEPVADLEEACREALREAGPGARLAVLPHGPITIPYLA